jgi:hypothetical protein
MLHESIDDRLNFVAAANNFVYLVFKKLEKFPKLICIELWNNFCHSEWLLSLEQPVFLERASFHPQSFVPRGLLFP